MKITKKTHGKNTKVRKEMNIVVTFWNGNDCVGSININYKGFFNLNTKEFGIFPDFITRQEAIDKANELFNN